MAEKLPLQMIKLLKLKKCAKQIHRQFLQAKKISELTDLKFLVKDYQRGYRWTQSEVQDLLDDINALSIEEDGYCMQPLVVKQLTIDNQRVIQRLSRACSAGLIYGRQK